MGNLVVIIGIFRLRKKATVTDIFVANLAAADFLFTAFCPIWAMERFRHGEWLMGEVMCQVATFIRLLKFVRNHCTSGFNPCELIPITYFIYVYLIHALAHSNTHLSLLNLYASVILLVIMSLDRYLSVVYPLKAVRFRTKGSAWKAVLVAWTLSSGFSIKVI